MKCTFWHLYFHNWLQWKQQNHGVFSDSTGTANRSIDSYSELRLGHVTSFSGTSKSQVVILVPLKLLISAVSVKIALSQFVTTCKGQKLSKKKHFLKTFGQIFVFKSPIKIVIRVVETRGCHSVTRRCRFKFQSYVSRIVGILVTF